MNAEKKRRDILEGVKDFPRITAGDDFYEKLEKRIEEYEREKEAARLREIAERRRRSFKNLIDKFRRPSLIPAIALIILALLILYFVFLKTETPQDNEKIKTEIQEEIQIENEKKKTPIEEIKPKESISEDKKKTKQKTQQTKTKKKVSPPVLEFEKESIIEPNKKQLDNLTGKENKIPSVVPRDLIKDKEIVKADAKPDSNENRVKNNSFDEKFNLMDKGGLKKLKEKIFKIKK